MSRNDKIPRDDGVVFESVWSELKKIYGVRNKERPWFPSKLTQADLERWARDLDIANDDLLELLAIRLARGFYTREYDFTFCDAIINHMFSTEIGVACQPNYFFEIFSAFDAGEFYRKSKEDEDPSEAYTRPLIAKIIESIDSKT